MSTMALSDVPQVRREFLIDVMFAENYELGHLDDLGPSVKNPVVERLSLRCYMSRLSRSSTTQSEAGVITRDS
jgi:hypothetical protein